MPTVEERLASLEAKVEAIADLRHLIAELRGDMNARFTSIDGRFANMDARFTTIDTRFTSIDARFTSIDTRFTEMSRLIASLDAKVDRHFVWLMGMMVTGFIAVIGALISVVYK